MSVEEKAQELYKEYFNITPQPYTEETVDGLKFNTWDKDWTKKYAKQSAIKACDKIIGLLDSLDKPEYVAFFLKDQVSIETEYATHLHGYELKQFYEDVRASLETF